MFLLNMEIVFITLSSRGSGNSTQPRVRRDCELNMGDLVKIVVQKKAHTLVRVQAFIITLLKQN